MTSSWWCSPATRDAAGDATGDASCLDRVVAALTRAGFEFGPPQPSTRTLLDTADGRLHRAGARLEARPVYVPGTAHAVELLPAGGGLPERRLVVERLPRTPDELPAGHLRERLVEVVGIRALIAQLTVTSNCAHALRRDGDGTPVARVELHSGATLDLAERRHLGLDPRGSAPATAARAAGTAGAAGAAGAWCVEHHHLSGPSSTGRRLRLALTERHAVGDGDALDRFASLAGLELDGFQPGSRQRLPRSARAEDAYRRVLHHLGDGVAVTWQGAADDLDPEFLHDLRTTLRRARTVLKVARGVLPEASRLDAVELADALAALTGEARDLDVHVLDWITFAEGLDAVDTAALEPVRDLLARRRIEAHGRLRDSLDAIGRDAWLERWRSAIDAPAPLADRAPRDARRRAGKVVADRLERAHRRLLRDGRRLRPTSPPEAFHELRKDAKRLRATVDGFGSLVRAPHRRAYATRLKVIQDHLGRLQDTAVQREGIDAFVGELGDLPDATRVALVNLGVTLDDRHDELVAGFAVVFERFDRGATRRALDRVLDDLRG